MYFYFMSLVHVAFRGSFLAYPVKIIGSMAILFFFLMFVGIVTYFSVFHCQRFFLFVHFLININNKINKKRCIIGGFYMTFLYIDFSSVGPINSPADCDKFEASQYSTITIWTGATCDAIWSFTCLLLFYLRLRKITKLMTKQEKLERQQTDEMIAKIKNRHSITTDDNDNKFKQMKRVSQYSMDIDSNDDDDFNANETEGIIANYNNNNKHRATITEWNTDQQEENEKDTIETVSINESLPTSGYIGSPPTTNYIGSTNVNNKALSTVNELLPIPTKNDTHNVTPSPSTSPPSTPKHEAQDNQQTNTVIVLQVFYRLFRINANRIYFEYIYNNLYTKKSRSDGSTLSGGTSNMSTITMDVNTDADEEMMDGIILNEMDEEEEEETTLTTTTNTDHDEMKTIDGNITNNRRHSGHQYCKTDTNDVDETTQTQEYTLMKQKYQNTPHIAYAYDDKRRNSQSSSAKMLTSFKLKFDNTSRKIKKKIKRRNSWNNMINRRRRNKKKKKPDIVHKFLPIMLKLSILSAWAACTTFGLGFGLWVAYPTLSSVIDSTINAFCVYLSFGFTKPLYQLLCSPFISCRNCEDYRNVVDEANKMEKDKDFEMEDTVLG